MLNKKQQHSKLIIYKTIEFISIKSQLQMDSYIQTITTPKHHQQIRGPSLYYGSQGGGGYNQRNATPDGNRGVSSRYGNFNQNQQNNQRDSFNSNEDRNQRNPQQSPGNYSRQRNNQYPPANDNRNFGNRQQNNNYNQPRNQNYNNYNQGENFNNSNNDSFRNQQSYQPRNDRSMGGNSQYNRNAGMNEAIYQEETDQQLNAPKEPVQNTNRYNNQEGNLNNFNRGGNQNDRGNFNNRGGYNNNRGGYNNNRGGFNQQGGRDNYNQQGARDNFGQQGTRENYGQAQQYQGNNQGRNQNNYRQSNYNNQNRRDNQTPEGAFRGNSYERNNQGNYNNYRRQDRDNYSRNELQKRQISENQLHKILGDKQNVQIQNHKLLKLNPKICVPIRSSPYILPTKQLPKADSVNVQFLSSFKGVQKAQLSKSPAKVNRFYSFPQLQGGEEMDAIKGFRESTGMTFQQFERLAQQLQITLKANFDANFR